MKLYNIFIINFNVCSGHDIGVKQITSQQRFGFKNLVYRKSNLKRALFVEDIRKFLQICFTLKNKKLFKLYFTHTGIKKDIDLA